MQLRFWGNRDFSLPLSKTKFFKKDEKTISRICGVVGCVEPQQL